MKQKVLLPPITKGSCWPLRNLNFTSNSPRWSSGDSSGCRNCLDTNSLESVFIGTKQKHVKASYIGIVSGGLDWFPARFTRNHVGRLVL